MAPAGQGPGKDQLRRQDLKQIAVVKGDLKQALSHHFKIPPLMYTVSRFQKSFL